VQRQNQLGIDSRHEQDQGSPHARASRDILTIKLLTCRYLAGLGKFFVFHAIEVENSHSRSPISLPDQSRACEVESTWSSYFPLLKVVSSCRYSGSHSAFSGR
jgi:hypothetical protein